MHIFNPIFALVLVLFAVAAVRVTFIWIKGAPAPQRFGTIDGLRGYLAFFVFLHHAAVWYAYTRSGIWETPQSHLYSHLGESSVALFFMITSFLFYDKLLRSKGHAFDWRSFFAGRMFRLAPLYLFAMLIMFMMVAILSDGTLFDKPRYILFCAVRWLLFTLPGAPNINHIDAGRIFSFVTWSLRYEWCFYLALPLVSFTTGQRPPWVAIVIGIAGIGIAWYIELHMAYAVGFVGGMIAARLVRVDSWATFARHRLASYVVIACISIALMFSSVYALIPFFFLTCAFCLIASGTSLFGILARPTSRRFGEIAYSIYLLHGIFLYSMINFVFTQRVIAAMSSTAYWACVAAVTPVLLVVSALTFRYIEQPGIDMGRRFVKRWRNSPVAGIPAPAVGDTVK